MIPSVFFTATARGWITGLCLILLVTSCSFFSAGRQQKSHEPARCLPSFPDRDGWYGADGAYSVQLDDHRTLWLFGDTFGSGESGRRDRKGMDLILGNTLAVSTCRGNDTFHIRYYLKKKNGVFLPSFGENEWLWPQAPFIARGILYIPLLVVEKSPGAAPPFNFKIGGHKFARIRNFQAENPLVWPVDYLDWSLIPAPGIEALATTSVVHHDHVYFYPLYRDMKTGSGISGNILARIAISRLDQPANHLEYWTQGGWQKNLPPENVKIIFPAGLSELSVRYHDDDHLWWAVYVSPANRGNQLLYQTAPSLEGPWSRPEVLLKTIAEVDPNSPLYNRHTFCYAGKEHRQFAFAREVVATYVCNSSADIDDSQSFLRNHLFLYRPVVKIIRPSGTGVR